MDFNYIMSDNLKLEAKCENFQTFLSEIKAIIKDIVEIKGLEFKLIKTADLPNFFKTDYQRI